VFNISFNSVYWQDLIIRWFFYLQIRLLFIIVKNSTKFQFCSQNWTVFRSKVTPEPQITVETLTVASMVVFF